MSRVGESAVARRALQLAVTLVALAVPQGLWVLALAASLAHADGAIDLAEQLAGRAAIPWVFIAGLVLLAVFVPVASLAAAWITRHTLFGHREHVGDAEQGIWCAAVVLLAAFAASAFTPLLWLILPCAAGALLAVPPRTPGEQGGPRV